MWNEHTIFFSSLFWWWRPSSITRLHLCASSGWDEMNVYLCAKEKKKSAIITYTNVHLTRHTVSSKGKQEFFSHSLSFPFCFSSCLAFIQSSVMPSWCAYNVLLQTLIIFIFYFTKIFSTNDYHHHHHHVLKVDVGQDVTMSCIFDEEKIEQVKNKIWI